MTRVRWIGLLGIALAALIVLSVAWRGSSGTAQNPTTRPVLWSVDFESIERIAIALPARGRGHVWVKGSDGQWYFEQPDGAKVDQERWGAGIPLLVSGPAAERLIAESVSDEQLSIYGFTHPEMTVRIGVTDAAPLEVEVGERTPDGRADYVRLASSPAVYAVHHTWKDELARLVTDPPVAHR